MTIHYHGTPLTPRSELWKMAGKSFCVSFAHPGDAEVVLRIGQSIMWDIRAETLEEAAKVADEDNSFDGDFIAAAIRALKGDKP